MIISIYHSVFPLHIIVLLSGLQECIEGRHNRLFNLHSKHQTQKTTSQESWEGWSGGSRYG